MVKIRYNKERSRNRRVSQEGQLGGKFKPSIHAEVAKSDSGAPLDLSQYLPLSVVRKKLEEAVKATKEAEHKRYKSGLNNINSQLNASKKQKSAIEDKLIDANAEIKRLRTQISDAPIVSEEAKNKLHEKEIEIARLESAIKTRETSDNKSEILINTLQEKLDKLYNKISDGSIQPFVGSKIDRPGLEDKIFIDPIDKSKEPKLDSYIDIKEEEPKEEKRDMKTDLSKLRRLLDM